MLRCVAPLFVGLIALTSAASADGPALAPGAKAPHLEVKRWVKGGETTVPKRGVAVVEFWATWCGPCVESIPHLTELAHKNPSVKFIGVSIWEDDANGTIDKFVQKMGDKMDYHVAYSGNQDGMAVSWMKAAQQNGIPTAFILKDGVVQWIGHPMAMQQALQEVSAGTFDLGKEKTQFAESVRRAEAAAKTRQELGAIDQAFYAGSAADAHARLDAFAKDHPNDRSVAEMKFRWLATENQVAFLKQVDEKLAAKSEAAFDEVAGLASRLESRLSTQKLAEEAIDRAARASNDTNVIVLYYAAYIHKQNKDSVGSHRYAQLGLDALTQHKEMEDGNIKELLSDMLKN